MKKLLCLFGVLVYIYSAPALAQKTKVQTAWNYYKYDELDKAKAAIDEASANESTSGSSKTWYYRGLIYQKMYKHEKYGSLDPDCLIKAFDSYSKAIELDPKYEFAAEIGQNKRWVANQIYGAGVDKFNAKEYQSALSNFEYLIKQDGNDTLSLLNAAYCADKSGDKVKAGSYYSRLISMNYNDPKVYVFYSGILKSDNRNEEALRVIQDGRKRFPAENALIIEELNMYLTAGKDKEALESLNFAIQSDPTNKNLYFAKGSVQDKLGNKTEAAAAYKKAIELDPNYFDPNYNLGAMYFNDGAEMANKANDLKSNAEFAKAKTEYEAKFREAMPYLEKALEINPKDANTLISLKQLYARLNEMEKYEKVKKMMDEK
ncbi:MAG TPA: tetratricopeptide repeat protein [Bacteroidia bacterium]|nr:tetratricopeptide repeat protein [Bacteroidia bacterium]